jgi:hypothetical protein
MKVILYLLSNQKVKAYCILSSQSAEVSYFIESISNFQMQSKISTSRGELDDLSSEDEAM